MSMRLEFTAITDRGLVRGNNEDSAFAGPHLLALADGMGGHAAGEVASTLMIEHMVTLERDPEDNDMLALLGAAAEDANAAIQRHVREHPETDGMGTTLTALLFNGSEFGVCHVGDSRGYRLRGGALEQFTRDDTYVQSLVEEGQLDPGDVSSHPQKSLILKAYAGRPVDPTLFMLDAQVGDRLLLCSDGLSDPVTASTIELALSQGSVEEAATTLRDLALKSGGPDNVTIVLAEVVEGDIEDVAPLSVGAIQGVVPEPTHPDSAASRAAKLVTQPAPVASPPRKKGPGVAVIGALIVVLLVTVGGWVFAKTYLSSTYYVAADDAGVMTIQQGADYEVFGRPLHHTYQHACLDKDNGLRLSNGECAGETSAFRVLDLPESERAVVGNLQPGSYDEVQSQLSTLSSKALDVCPKAASTSAAKATDKPTEKITRKPGVTCREVI